MYTCFAVAKVTKVTKVLLRQSLPPRDTHIRKVDTSKSNIEQEYLDIPTRSQVTQRENKTSVQKSDVTVLLLPRLPRLLFLVRYCSTANLVCQLVKMIIQYMKWVKICRNCIQIISSGSYQDTETNVQCTKYISIQYLQECT